MDLVYSTLSAHLMKMVPELDFPYRQLLSEWAGEDPGPHIVYGDLFLPWLNDALRGDDKVRLVEVFEFLEKLACHSDMEVQNVVAHSIVEPGLVADKSMRTLAKRYMGPALRKLVDCYATG